MAKERTFKNIDILVDERLTNQKILFRDLDGKDVETLVGSMVQAANDLNEVIVGSANRGKYEFIAKPGDTVEVVKAQNPILFLGLESGSASAILREMLSLPVPNVMAKKRTFKNIDILVDERLRNQKILFRDLDGKDVDALVSSMVQTANDLNEVITGSANSGKYQFIAKPGDTVEVVKAQNPEAFDYAMGQKVAKEEVNLNEAKIAAIQVRDGATLLQALKTLVYSDPRGLMKLMWSIDRTLKFISDKVKEGSLPKDLFDKERINKDANNIFTGIPIIKGSWEITSSTKDSGILMLSIIETLWNMSAEQRREVLPFIWGFKVAKFVDGKPEMATVTVPALGIISEEGIVSEIVDTLRLLGNGGVVLVSTGRSEDDYFVKHEDVYDESGSEIELTWRGKNAVAAAKYRSQGEKLIKAVPGMDPRAVKVVQYMYEHGAIFDSDYLMGVRDMMNNAVIPLVVNKAYTSDEISQITAYFVEFSLARLNKFAGFEATLKSLSNRQKYALSRMTNKKYGFTEGNAMGVKPKLELVAEAIKETFDNATLGQEVKSSPEAQKKARELAEEMKTAYKLSANGEAALAELLDLLNNKDNDWAVPRAKMSLMFGPDALTKNDLVRGKTINEFVFSPRSTVYITLVDYLRERYGDGVLKASDADKAGLVDGGINFNSANLALQIKRDGAGVPLPVSQQNLDNIHFDGHVPVILNIRSASSAMIPS